MLMSIESSSGKTDRQVSVYFGHCAHAVLLFNVGCPAHHSVLTDEMEYFCALQQLCLKKAPARKNELSPKEA